MGIVLDEINDTLRTFHRFPYGIKGGEVLVAERRGPEETAHLLVVVVLELYVVGLVKNGVSRVVVAAKVLLRTRSLLGGDPVRYRATYRCQ